MKSLFQRKPKVTKDTIAIHLVNEQLAYVNKTWDDVKDDPEWFRNNTLTKKQYNEWKDYSIKVIQDVYKFDYQQASLEFSWFDMGYGLSVKK